MVALVKEEQITVKVPLKKSLSEQVQIASDALDKKFKGLKLPHNYRMQFLRQKMSRNGKSRELTYRIFWEIGSMSSEDQELSKT